MNRQVALIAACGAAALLGVLAALQPDAALGATSPVDDRLRAFFRRQKTVQVPEAALLRAFTRSELDRAVRREALRRGVTGYWLPATGDPGAAYVMRRQRDRGHLDVEL